MTGRTRIAIAATIASCLGSLALLPSFADYAWLPSAFGAAIAVGLVAEVARVLGVPRALAPLLSLAALTAYVTAVFARDHAFLGFIPTHETQTALVDLLRLGWHDINVLRAPVPSHRGLVLLTVLGAGGVALLVDFLAVTLRRAALAGLPLLALFAVPAATVPGGVGWLPFLYAGAGYLVLLLTDSSERVGRWGQPLGAGRRREEDGAPLRPARAETAALAAVGRRVGVAALGIAVVLPAAIPWLHPGLFGTRGGHGPGAGPGGNTVTTYNPITTIRRQLLTLDKRPLFRYASTDADPAYFRMTALDRFDGTSWTQGDLTAPASARVSKGMPPPDGVNATVSTVRNETRVSGGDRLSVPWLPLPYPATQVSVSGDWRLDERTRAVFSTKETTTGRSWTVMSARLLPTPEQLEQAPTKVSAEVNSAIGLDDRTIPLLLTSIAQRVTKDAGTPYAKAVALQAYFHSSKFHYSLDVSDNDSKDVIARFLRDGRGYCVQFASTMALMARVVGIPARVAIGFTHGDRQSDGTFQVTTAHAHAWPELYFAGLGWLTFEPTPRGDGQAEPPSYTQPGATTGPGTTTTPGASPTPQPSSSAALGADLSGKLRTLNSGDETAAPSTQPASSSNHLVSGLLTVLVVIALLLVLPAASRWLTRRRRWAAAETDAARAHAAWCELGDDVRDLGFRWRPDDSPRRTADRLAATATLGDAEDALQRLATAEERALYARTLDDVGDLAADHKEVRRALAAQATWSQRLLAVVLPRSTVTTALSVTTSAIADVLDLIDAGIAWLGRMLVPKRLRRT
jgi:transglutaminase-like putative cysteine protease